MNKQHFTMRLLAFTCLALLLTACGPEKTTQPGPSPTNRVSTSPVASSRSPSVSTSSARIVRSTQIRGSIPYDNRTLPIVSPDGRFVATQTGLTPEWKTILARPGAAVAEFTRVDIYEIPFGEDAVARRIASVPEPVLLGRSVSADGFLVESPRPDGSRWIGLAAWTTGEIDWLVTGETVNAFATLGPDNRLAFSRRFVDSDRFDLVVRSPSAEWSLPASGGSWFMPTFSGAGDSLFVLRLENDRLSLMHGRADSSASFRQSLSQQSIAAAGATDDTAYQSLIATVSVVDGRPRDFDYICFYHPDAIAAAVWEPPLTVLTLDRYSFAAVPDPLDNNFVLMLTPEELVRRSIRNERLRFSIAPGPHMARTTSSEKRPIILLLPQDSMIKVDEMNILIADQIQHR